LIYRFSYYTIFGEPFPFPHGENRAKGVCVKSKKVPPITAEALERFGIAYKEAYPCQALPADLQKSLKRMFRRAVDRDAESWNIFISTNAPSILLVMDRYAVTVEKDPVRITRVKAFPAKDEARFAHSCEGPPLDPAKIRFVPAALNRFAQLFPHYIDGDIERSARSMLAKASEKNAISDKLKTARLLTHGFTPSRYFRFCNCRFVVMEIEDGFYLVPAIEKVFWK
jgi:hypothetical protein